MRLLSLELTISIILRFRYYKDVVDITIIKMPFLAISTALIYL